MSDSFRNHWYSQHLESMGEPVLKSGGDSKTYRFPWLRSFHHPVAIRLVDNDGHCTRHATELDGAGGYGPGAVFRKETLGLTADKCAEVERLLQTTRFWQLAPHEGTNGKDGAEWIIEGMDVEYRVVSRWSPTAGPIRQIGEKMLALSGWEYPADEMY